MKAREGFKEYDAKRREYWMSQGKCPYCAEHRPLSTQRYCAECERVRLDRQRSARMNTYDEWKIEKYIRGIHVDGDWPKSVYLNAVNRFRVKGTRYDNVLRLIEQGFSADVILNSFEGMDEKTLIVYKKILTGRISGVAR